MDPPAAGNQLRSDLNLAYPILSDAQTEVSSQYALYNIFRDGVSAPAVFILNEHGVIHWRYIGQSFDDRPPISALMAALESLS